MRARLRHAWQASTYLMVGVATAQLAWLLVSGLTVVTVLALVLVGLPWLPQIVRGLRRFAGVERRRAARILGEPIPERYTELTGPLTTQLRQIVNDPATGRDALWLLLHATVGLMLGAFVLGLWLSVPLLLSIPLWWWAVPSDGTLVLTDLFLVAPEGQGLVVNGLVVDTWGRALTVPLLNTAGYLAVLAPVTPWLARTYARLARRLLAPSERTRLAERVEELTETRSGAVDAHGAELRRIERDLHDGTQARLVAIAMRLGMAEKGMAADPEKAAQLLREAIDGTEEAMTELRQVVRSIYPPILSDRGLDGAVSALVAACPVPVTTEVGTVGRMPAAVEAAAYFVIAEALTNITKHAGAGAVHVAVRREGDTLHVVVQDDGKGGADEQAGSGLAGIRRRVAAFDGRYRLTSPAGGPTELTVELPCGS